jgi:hypothetical protein
MTVAGFLSTLAFDLDSITTNFSILSYSLFFIRLYGAFADCLGDALIVKSGKHDEEDAPSGLQSISWFSYAFGAAVFGILAGQLQTDETNKEGNEKP